MYRTPDQLLRTLKMVKLKGPGLAARAAGQLAGELIFSDWKGTAYLKQYRKPKQPRTAAQRSVRAVLQFLSEEWFHIIRIRKDTWNELAAARNISPFNAYQAENLTNWSSGLFPSHAFPAERSLFWGNVDYTTVEQDGQRALWKIKLATQGASWGSAIHELPGPASDPTPLNLTKLLALPDTEEHTWHTRRLEPGTYYFRTRQCSTDGKSNFPGGARQVTIT